VHEVSITSSWQNLTDTASVLIPKKLVYKRKGEVVENIVGGENPIFKREDAVTLSGGYDDTVNDIFKGFIREIYPKLPLKFECEDAMYLLKQTNVEKFARAGINPPGSVLPLVSGQPYKLTDLIRELFEDQDITTIPVQAFDVAIGDVRIMNSSIAEVLQNIKKTMGLVSWMRDGTLFSGLAYITRDQTKINTIHFTFEKNIIDDSRLIFKLKDDQKLKVKVVVFYPDSTKQEKIAGNALGEQVTIHLYNIPTEDAQKIADERIARMKFDGYRGSFTAFLLPKVQHGDAVKLTNPTIPEREGVYLVKQVITTYGINGGRQEIFLDAKIA